MNREGCRWDAMTLTELADALGDLICDEDLDDEKLRDRMSVAASNLRLIRFFGESLTRRQLNVLALMRDREEADPGCDEAELVRECCDAYLDDTRIASRTVDALLRACAISDESSGLPVERYRINETGRAILKRAGR